MQITDRKFLNVNTNFCHASTIAFYQDKPVFAWFGGATEGCPDTAIFIQYNDKVVTIGGEDSIPRWNPVLFPYKDRLFLFVKAGVFCDRWNTFIYNISDIFKDDFNINNTKASIISAGLNGPVKTKCIEKNGLIYCGSSVETFFDWASYIETWIYDKEEDTLIFVQRSMPLVADKKVYETRQGVRALTKGLIQPSLWLNNGIMNAFLRSSTGLGKIYHSSSNDKMHNVWSKPQPTQFYNPNSGIDTVYCNDRLFLVYNPGETSRYPLVINELDDKWNIIDQIIVKEEISALSHNTKELSYPYMIEHNNQLHLTYTYGRSACEYVIIDI